MQRLFSVDHSYKNGENGKMDEKVPKRLDSIGAVESCGARGSVILDA